MSFPSGLKEEIRNIVQLFTPNFTQARYLDKLRESATKSKRSRGNSKPYT